MRYKHMCVCNKHGDIVFNQFNTTGMNPQHARTSRREWPGTLFIFSKKMLGPKSNRRETQWVTWGFLSMVHVKTSSNTLLVRSSRPEIFDLIRAGMVSETYRVSTNADRTLVMPRNISEDMDDDSRACYERTSNNYARMHGMFDLLPFCLMRGRNAGISNDDDRALTQILEVEFEGEIQYLFQFAKKLDRFLFGAWNGPGWKVMRAGNTRRRHLEEVEARMKSAFRFDGIRGVESSLWWGSESADYWIEDTTEPCVQCGAVSDAEMPGGLATSLGMFVARPKSRSDHWEPSPENGDEDFGELYEDLGELHQDLGELHEDLGELHEDLGELYEDLGELDRPPYLVVNIADGHTVKVPCHGWRRCDV
ncbi:hypothetical protein GNI_102310 [Gregarina niphandrodes]|uniref:Uncharacterized protein n=1 Tax=Gregarina niphandrodes TaxID=110365 RepID=A0A023B4E3_GRENI|nr:hypothetical protein GNI_102310 [Gregarina niphandrodes]EZG56670.1 hypothetical protein GNI_102310 [Gregarina niphandrodes]|eukprot:XP_011131212.1 hypothetical protein GNI_102310 [Gregarina niphandrodes]